MAGIFEHGSIGIVYYKIMLWSKNDLYTVVCLQDFDEIDYDQSMFVRNSDDEIHVFENEEMAVDKLNEWYRAEQIDPEYLKMNVHNPDMTRD